MKLFPNGIAITRTEYTALLHVEADPEQWLKEALLEKARLRRDALINEWRPKLFADSSVADLPADADALARLILSRRDCKSRHQQELKNQVAGDPNILGATTSRTLRNRGINSTPCCTYNVTMFNTRPVSGPTVTLFSNGIDIDQTDCDCILAYVDNLEDWVLGALLGHINRGKKKMIREWQPKLFADPNVSNIPANEDQLIQVIVNHPDYKTLAEL